MIRLKNRISSLFHFGKRTLNSRDGKTLASNFAWLTVLQVAGYVFPLITLPYLARVIGVDGFGKIAFAAAVIVWLQTIADWGFNFTATRDVAKNREDLDKVSDIFSTVLWSRCFLLAISYAVMALLILTIPKFYEARAAIMVTSLMLIGHILYPEWFFQAMERMKYITILGVVAKLVFTAAVFVFIRKPEHYILQPLFVSLGFVVSGIIAFYLILFRWGVRLRKPSFKSIITTIKGSTDIFINNLMPNLYNSFSIVLLGLYGNATQNGLYDAGKKLSTVSFQFISVISRTFFPYLSRNNSKHSLFVRFFLGIALFVSAVLFVFAKPLLLLFYSESFLDAVPVMRLTSLSLFFLAMSSAYGTNYLLVNNHDRLLRNITMVVSLIGFIIAFPLIRFFGYMGAAWTFTISTVLMGVLPMIAALRIKHGKNKNRVI